MAMHENIVECDDKDDCTIDECANGFCSNVIDSTKWVLQLELTFDEYAEETAWVIKDKEGIVLNTGGDYKGYSRDEILTQNIYCAAADEARSKAPFLFMIHDSEGNGMCCKKGQGGYVIKVNGEERARGGNFGALESKTVEFKAGTAPETPVPPPITPAPTPAPTSAPTPKPTPKPTSAKVPKLGA